MIGATTPGVVTGGGVAPLVVVFPPPTGSFGTVVTFGTLDTTWLTVLVTLPTVLVTLPAVLVTLLSVLVTFGTVTAGGFTEVGSEGAVTVVLPRLTVVGTATVGGRPRARGLSDDATRGTTATPSPAQAKATARRRISFSSSPVRTSLAPY
jgi:hypothetical protein